MDTLKSQYRQERRDRVEEAKTPFFTLVKTVNAFWGKMKLILLKVTHDKSRNIDI